MNDTSSPPGGLPPLLETPPAGAASSHRRRWWIHLILVSAYILVVAVVGRESSEKRTHVPALSHTAGGLLLVCAIQLLIFAAVLGLALMASRASRDDLWLRWRPGVWPVPLGVIYSLALRLAVGMVMATVVFALMATHLATAQSMNHFLAVNRPDLEAVVDISALRQNPAYFWLTLTVVSFVVGGLREELWRSAFLAGLRHLWPQHFGTRAGQVGAVAVAAVLFGFAHLAMGWIAVLVAGLLGLGLGLIMVFHQSIWPAVIAHGMFDATSLAMLPWIAEKLPEIQRAMGH